MKDNSYKKALESSLPGQFQGAFVTALVICSLLLFCESCNEDEKIDSFQTGEPISGIEIFYPLASFTGDPLMPKISPDGTMLLFTGPSNAQGWQGLWIMNLESQQLTQLHPNGRLADWSPDSGWVVFNNGTAIFKIRTDGTELTMLLPNDGYYEPDWSHDDRIYFGGNQGAGIMNADGTNQLFLSELGGQGDWHPQEDIIITIKASDSPVAWYQFFVCDPGENSVLNMLGAKKNRLNQYPKYSPSGDQICFFNESGISIMNSNGENLTRIIPSYLTGPDRKQNPKLYTAFPSWHPDGQRIVYENFEITKSKRVDGELLLEGYLRFYLVNVDAAISLTNLN